MIKKIKMNYFEIAWRNIWRNKRRTLITVTAVFIAVFLSTLISSMQEGTYSKMIDNIVKFYSGYLQIQHPEFKTTKSINEVIELDSLNIEELKKTENVLAVAPRIEYYTLFSTGNNTKGGLIIGIDPEMENNFSNFSRWLKEGEYLSKGDSGILIAENLAKLLSVKIGDTIILLSQGYHGATAAGLFVLKGILKFPSPQLNNFAYIDLSRAQDFFMVYNKVTSVALMLPDYTKVKETKKDIEKKVSKNIKILSWDELHPEIVQMIEADRAGDKVMKAILYMIVGFGILGTVIMMISERKKELAIMIAVGMRKTKLSVILFLEILNIGFLGIILGFVVSFPFILYFVYHPIPLGGKIAEVYKSFGIQPALYFSMIPSVFVNQILTIVLITFLVSFYPMYQIFKMNVIKCLRG